MTRKDTLGIMALLETAYPAFYGKLDEKRRMEAVNLWAELFADDPPQLVYAAVKTIIVSGGAFPPSVGEVKQKMHDITSSNELTETQAWALVSKALHNGIYGYKAEYDDLPPVVQAAVGSAEQLRDWAVMDEKTVQSVVASNFMRGYNTTVKRERELSLVPVSVRVLLDDVGDKLALPE